MLVGGCILVLFGGIVGLALLAGGFRQVSPDRKDSPNTKPDLAVENDKREKDRRPDELSPKPAPVNAAIALAPPPRAVPLNRPPDGFTSAWVQNGGVRTRVTGAGVTFPVLTDDTGREFPSKAACLLVWVEAQSVTANGVSLRRWVSPLNEPATLVGADDVRIKPAKLPTGARVGGQLVGGHSLVPGGPAVVDVIAFEVPTEAARRLYLKLTGTHVAESADYYHAIPYEVWSKK